MTTITILPKHMRKGKIGDAGRCPIANAINPFLADGFVVRVHADLIRVCGDWPRNIRCNIEMPKKLQTFVKRFDRGETVKPIEFSLDIPSEYLAENPSPERTEQ